METPSQNKADSAPLAMQAARPQEDDENSKTHTPAEKKESEKSAPKKSEKKTTGQDTVLLTDSMLQQFIQALRPRPFYKRHPILFACILIAFTLFVGSCFFSEDVTLTDEDRVAVVRVEGLIMDTRPLLEWIESVKQDSSVKGVLLRIDSPGGGAAASQEIHSALVALAKRKPLVASMGSSAASGGLMVAMAADYIVANPSTVTGSIGVRMDILQLQDLMEGIGVGRETLKTGKFKDAGDALRPLSDEERAYLESVMQDMHEQFVLLVAEGRKMTPEQVHPLADGRVFTGRQALALGLVDTLGGQDIALAELYQQTSVLPTTPLYEKPDPADFWRELAEAALDISFTMTQSLPRPSFLYHY